MSRTLRARAAVSAAAVLILSALSVFGGSSASAAPSYTRIEGSGSSWAAYAIGTWVADVQAQGMEVVFTSTGSAQGRKDFALQSSDFGVSDIGFQGVDPLTKDLDTNQGRPFAYLPIAAGGTSIIYNLKSAGKRIDNLRLSGDTLTRIFTNKITMWNDPLIAADNPGLTLPATVIVPVVHGEGSGSSAQFTRYMAKQYSDLWRAYAPETFVRGGVDAGQAEIFPINGKTQMIAQNGSDQVINYITSSSGDGTIGYDEYSYALGKQWPVARILNTAGYYTMPSQYNVAVALTAAQIDLDPTSPTYLLQNLDNVYSLGDPRVYPISSYSYMILPTGSKAEGENRVSSSKRQTLADFLFHSICQGQGEIGNIGYSSLPVNLVTAGFQQIARLKDADPNIDLNARDVTACNNPTFDAADPSANKLAEIAPNPLPCAKQGAMNCAAADEDANANPKSVVVRTSTGTATDGGSTDSPAGPSAADGGQGGGASANPSADGGGTGNPSDTGAGTGGTGGTIDPETGQLVDGGGGGGGTAVAVATQLAASRTNGPTGVLGPLAVLELLAALIIPVVLSRQFSRSRRKS
jgi:phosphate transport system substrate-binding protein